jgi:hypothetical protein
VRFLREKPHYIVIAGFSILVVALLLLTGCGAQKATEPFKDAPVSQHNDDPAAILNMPDGFNNVATKCDGPNRVYVVFHNDNPYGSVAVVPNDPRCTGGTTP